MIIGTGSHRTFIRFWAENGTTQLANTGGGGGGETFVTRHEFAEAGTYQISFEVGDAARSTWVDDEEKPQHWAMPYTIDLREVETAE